MASVLIVGATSAIAQEIAKIHAARGDRLALLGRDPLKLDGITSELGAAVAYHEAGDFNDFEQNEQRLGRAIRMLGGELDVAIVCHGWLGSQLESERSVDHSLAVLHTNLSSVISFVVPIVNHLERKNHGALVVLSSVAGDRGRPRNYTYGAAKGALSIYLQGVRSRLYRSKVRVCTIRLGPVDTPMTVDHQKNPLFARATAVAKTIVRLERRGPEDAYVPGYWWPIMSVVRGLPERVFQRFSFLAGR